jgi:UDP-2,3-diacylglucosamine pyrophosphatase LpxH
MNSYYDKRLDRAFQTAPRLTVGNRAKIVVMSDCHRGCGSLADDYAKNQNVCYAALRSYSAEGYDYIEAGDGDELWKNKSFRDIADMHEDVFSLLARFYGAGRFVMLYGNHDLEKKIRPNLLRDAGQTLNGKAALLPALTACEGVVLIYAPTGREIFIVHGHQADFFKDRLWRLARWLVRYVWRPLELVGFSDPKSAAKNNKVKEKVERRLKSWADERGVLVIAGHTHRAVFPEPSAGLYFNDGSCVHPWSITAVEIVGGDIALVGWRQKTRDDGTVYIGRDVIAGPVPLRQYIRRRAVVTASV